MQPFFIDFHCHPDMKPYGKTWSQEIKGRNTTDTDSEFSIWHRKDPGLLGGAVQLATGVAKFTQSDFTSLTKGNCRLICPSLYSIEKGFFDNKLGTGEPSDLADSFIAGVGKPRVDYIQNINNYYEDLQLEYQYYLQLHNTTVNIDGVGYKYYIIRNYMEMQQYIDAHSDADNVLFVALTIEGLHTLNTNLAAPASVDDFLKNLQAVKQWDYPPFFITFCHHFYNQLCGHAQSLFQIVHNNTDQSEGMNTTFTEIGLKVLDAMLDTTTGKRIYPDIKHMSAQGRKDYLNLLSTKYAGENIPVIVSHGAANGFRSMDEQVIDGTATGSKLMPNDINFYDNEILAVARSGGIFCLQLDEHRLASDETLKQIRHSVFLNKIRHYRSELVWNQVQHIAELLDRNGLDAWNCMALGTDSDGIINPLNGFLTEETLPDLQSYLERHVYNYMSGRGAQILQPGNQVNAADIVNRIFYSNGLDFFKKWFI